MVAKTLPSQWSSIAGLLIVIAVVCAFTATAQPLAGLKFCIDPGHGGNNTANDRLVIPDPGVNFWESESNFQKALLLKPLLEARGATVILTRYTNSYPNDADEPSLSSRVALANANNVDWFHSIHSNATGGTNSGTNSTLMLVREKRSDIDPAASTGNGMGIPERAESWTMSQILSPKVKSFNRTTGSSTWLDWTFYGGTNGGFSLGVLRGLLMPGELSEGSFHDYYPETRRLMNNAYREVEAYAIMYSFLQYVGAPTESIAIIAGIQQDGESGRPKNSAVVRLLPENRVFTGDAYYNGYFMFDSVSDGSHTVRFESPGYSVDSVVINTITGGVHFVDRTLYAAVGPTIINSIPVAGDSAYPVSSVFGVQFSRPMDTTSVRRAFHLTPWQSGTFVFYNNSQSVIFDPVDPLPYGTTFTWIIDSTAKSAGGMLLDAKNTGSASSHVVRFRTASAPTSVDRDAPLSSTFRLLGTYPNPFNPSTTLRYEVPVESPVRIGIYDVVGREVARLVDGPVSAGHHSARFEAGTLPSGVYLARMTAGQTSSTLRLLLYK